VELLSVESVGIEDAGESRFALRLGGRFGVLRLGRDDRALQLGIEAGFASHFDNDVDQDNIGWDGHYGLTLTAGHGETLAWKVGLFHTSAHVGDEYAERTSRRRIGYTREEVLAGLSYRLAPRLRAYFESAYAYELRIAIQRPWRVQGGLVFEDADRFAGGRFGWYAATDVAQWEERDWRTDWALQAGLVYPAGARAWRLGLTVHDGRPPLGEFFQDTERSVSAGLSIDL
jgi:hypothetical protein